jgi:hypothetical protein
MGGAVVSGVIEANAIVAGLELPPWLVGLGPLGSAIIGGVVVAVANHLFTSRRERGAWLRQLQVKANQEFYAAAQDFMAYTVHGSSNHPLTGDDALEGSYGDEIARRRTVLNQRGLDLLPVAPDSILAVAKIATGVLPKLAYLAVPLTGTQQLEPAMTQSQGAIETMARVLEWVGAVMRDDVGLVGWRQHGSIKDYREQLSSMEVRCPIDEDGAPDPYSVLQDWRVHPIAGGEMPASLGGYRVNELNLEGEVPPGLQPQACAVKFRGQPWQLGVLREIPEPVAAELFRDAIRLITGHIHGYGMRHVPKFIQPVAPDQSKGVAFVWSGVTVGT